MRPLVGRPASSACAAWTPGLRHRKSEQSHLGCADPAGLWRQGPGRHSAGQWHIRGDGRYPGPATLAAIPLTRLQPTLTWHPDDCSFPVRFRTGARSRRPRRLHEANRPGGPRVRRHAPRGPGRHAAASRSDRCRHVGARLLPHEHDRAAGQHVRVRARESAHRRRGGDDRAGRRGRGRVRQPGAEAGELHVHVGFGGHVRHRGHTIRRAGGGLRDPAAEGGARRA